jgi:prophage regulatory protein
MSNKFSRVRGSLPEIGYVRQSQLIPEIFPFSAATLWRKVRAGTFPRPVKLGPRITAWRVEDIRGHIDMLRGLAPHTEAVAQ